MNTQQDGQKTYTVIVGLDYSELGDLALAQSCELAGAHARAHLHVVQVSAGATETDHDVARESLERTLGEASTRLHGHIENVLKRWCEARTPPTLPFERITTHVRSGRPAEAIAQLASDVEADLVVVGTHGRRGAQRFLLGSVAEGAVRMSPCAVLVVRPPDASVPQIEPPCPRCLETRRATNGSELWCEQHREHHGRRHTYHYAGAARAHQSGFLIHT